MTSEEIFEGIKKGELSWDKLSFNKKAFDYLKKNCMHLAK